MIYLIQIIFLMWASVAWATPCREVGDVHTFELNTNGSSGAVDADSAPTIRLYENNTDTVVTSTTMAKFDDANTLGFYKYEWTVPSTAGEWTARECAVISGNTICVADKVMVRAVGQCGTYLDVANSSRASQTSVDTIDDFVDTEVAAIKAKTDQLTFGTANRVDSTPLSLPSIPSNWITATGITAGALNGKGDWLKPLASGTADSGSTTTMVDAARTESAGYWKPLHGIIVFTSGTISGQFGLITAWDATTDTITFTPTTTSAVSTNTYEIWPWTNYGTSIIRVGTAQAGTAISITLDSGASGTDGFYVRDHICIINGTGASKPCGTITTYNGSTKVAGVAPNWEIDPASDSVFVVLASFPLDWANIINEGAIRALSGTQIAQAGVVGSVTNPVTINPETTVTVVAGSPNPTWQIRINETIENGQYLNFNDQLKLICGSQYRNIVAIISGVPATIEVPMDFPFSPAPSAGSTCKIRM